MTTTASTTQLPAPTMPNQTAQEIALEWLEAKDTENAGLKAAKVRSAAGKALVALLGRDATVTVNRGGFKTYAVNVTDVNGRADAAKAIAAMVQDGLLTQDVVDNYMQDSIGAGYEKIALKALKV